MNMYEYLINRWNNISSNFVRHWKQPQATRLYQQHTELWYNTPRKDESILYTYTFPSQSPAKRCWWCCKENRLLFAAIITCLIIESLSQAPRGGRGQRKACSQVQTPPDNIRHTSKSVLEAACFGGIRSTTNGSGNSHAPNWRSLRAC